MDTSDIPAAPAPEAPATEAPAPEEAPVEVADAEVQPEEAVAEDTTVAPPEEGEAPAPSLWSDEQWTGWDGGRDTLAEQYHPVFDRMTETQERAVSTMEQRLAEANESIRALALGDEDPHAGKELEQAQADLAQATERAAAAEKALADIQAAHEARAADEDAAEEARFRQEHAWAFDPNTSSEVRSAVLKLMDSMPPTRAGDVFKGMDPKKQVAVAEGILKGAPVDIAIELADLRMAPPKKEALPEPLPGAEFVNGTEPASTTTRRKRNQNDHPSAKAARYLMAEQMFK